MSFLLKKEGNRFTKTSRNVQGGIMRPPSDGGLKTLVFHCKANYLVWCLIKKVVRTLGEIHFHEKSSNVFCEAEIKSLLPQKSFLDFL